MARKRSPVKSQCRSTPAAGAAPRGARRGRPHAKRDLISIADLSAAEIGTIFRLSTELKDQARAGTHPPLLAGKTMAMIFHKPSLRTRVTFDIGMKQLGGWAIYLAPHEIQVGERESIADIAHNLARWVDVIVVRTYEHRLALELARSAPIPVVNGLTDLLHPCQVLADCFTLLEARGTIEGSRVVFVGDGNNVVHSWLHAAALLGFDFTIACPPGYEPHADIVAWARARAKGEITISHDPKEAVRGADVIYTDVWTSMGQERDAARRRQTFQAYQVNEDLVARAARDVHVMHCLPAHRGEEITDAVLDGPRSVALEQAENRLHVQKGALVWLLGDGSLSVAAARRPGGGPPPRRPRPG
jgi:ornithine carbamoyltransferase